MNSKTISTHNNRLKAILSVAAALLLTPLVAMMFTKEMKWSLADFIIAGILLFGTGLLCELVMRKVKTTRHRILLCGIVLVALFLIWAELAVGIFGSPVAGS